MTEYILKMPRTTNTFTGKCSLSFEQFEDLKQLVGIGKLIIVFSDKKVKSVPVEDWMIESAQVGATYVLMFHSKNLYLKHKKDHYRFAGKLKGEYVEKMDGTKMIVHHFTKKVLWRDE